MIRQTASLLTYVLVIAVTMAVRPSQIRAQEMTHYSHQELHRLIAQARTPDDYQKLAAYFQYQEHVYLAQTQAEIDDYASWVRNFTMVPKFPTRPDVTARLDDYYAYKADQNAKRAGRDDQMLDKLGVEPASATLSNVSVKSLERASAGSPGSELTEDRSTLNH